MSTWDDENLALLEKASKPYRLVTSSYPEKKAHATAYQSYTTYAGSVVASNLYVLKTRSDELYPDLSVFLDNWMQHPHRSHTTNNGFWKKYPHCYSCHLFLDKTEYVTEAMLNLHNYHMGDRYMKLVAAESEFGYFLMKARGFELNNDNWKDIMRDNVFITPCSELKGHLHSGATTDHRGFKRSSEPYPLGRAEESSNRHPESQLYHSHTEII